jgi:hypothetical protein
MKKTKQKVKSNNNLLPDPIEEVKPLPELPKKCPYPELEINYDFLVLQPHDAYRLMEAISSKDQTTFEYSLVEIVPFAKHACPLNQISHI